MKKLVGDKAVFFDNHSTDQRNWGGMRKMVFGTTKGLRKSALVLMDGRLKPFITLGTAQKGRAWHDISCLFRHYPFVSSFCAKVEDAARTGRYGIKVTDEYKMYSRGLSGRANLKFERETARFFSGLEPLIKDQFLIVSEKYRQWVAGHAQ